MGNEGKFDGAGETFISFGIIVSKTNLELNSFKKFALLSGCYHFIETFLQIFRIDFATKKKCSLNLKITIKEKIGE
jgi:hypothetical protein